MTTRPALRFRASVDLTEGPPLRRMLLFCLPVVAGNVFQMLYGAADAAAAVSANETQPIRYSSYGAARAFPKP